MVEADAVRYRFENAVSDKWRYNSDPEFGKESRSERQKLYTGQTIQEEFDEWWSWLQKALPKPLVKEAEEKLPDFFQNKGDEVSES